MTVYMFEPWLEGILCRLACHSTVHCDMYSQLAMRENLQTGLFAVGCTILDWRVIVLKLMLQTLRECRKVLTRLLSQDREQAVKCSAQDIPRPSPTTDVWYWFLLTSGFCTNVFSLLFGMFK